MLSGVGDDDKFKFRFIPVNRENVKKRKYLLDTPDPTMDDADEDYFDAIIQTFTRSAGFNKITPTGATLKKGILDQYEELTQEATEEYDAMVEEDEEY